MSVNNDFLDDFNPRAIALRIATRLRNRRFALNLSQLVSCQVCNLW